MKKKQVQKSIQTSTKKDRDENKPSFWQSINSNVYIQIAMMILVGVVFWINYDANFDKKLDLNGDNVYYYSLAQSLHEGKGYLDIIGFDETPHTHFPPGYSAFISTSMYFFGDTDYVPIKKLNGCLLFLSVVVFFLILKKITKNNLMLIGASLLLVCVHKDLLRWSTIMMSEMLYLFLTMVIIWTSMLLYEKKSFRQFTWKGYACLAILLLSVCYVYFVRTMGLSMVLGLIGWLAVLSVRFFCLYMKKRADADSSNYKKRSVFYMMLLGLVVLSFSVGKVAWTIRNNEVGHAKSDYISDFQKKKDGEKMSTFVDWSARVKDNARTYVVRLLPETILAKISNPESAATGGQIMLGVLVCVVVLVGFLKTGVAGFLVFSYLAVTFGVLLFWPEQYTSVRYYVATVPFVLFLFINGIYNCCAFLLDKLSVHYYKKAVNPVFVSLFVLCISLFWLTPTHVSSQADYRFYAKKPLRKVLPNINGLHYLEAVDWCKKNLPDSARLYCRKPELYYMYSNYHKAAMFPHYMPVDSVVPYFEKRKATHIIMDSWFKHAFVTILPAVKACPEKFKVIHTIGKVDTVTKENPTYILEFNPKWGYYGNRVEGKREGEGYELYQNGKKYVGSFHDNLPNGYGELFDTTGVIQMKGTWRNGRFASGEGYEYYGKRKYIGSFKDGLPDGFGIIFDTLGAEQARGTWKKGALVRMN